MKGAPDGSRPLRAKGRSLRRNPLEAAGAAVFADDGPVLLIRENYDRRRWGFPGGALEPGETPEEAVVREVREATGVEVRIDACVGSYSLADSSLVAHLFRCTIVTGTPVVPDTGEIAEVGWWPVCALPQPRTNLLHHALEDAVAGRTGLVRRGLARVT
jgi:8-oxo-dGTP pyrophosphatase MutT (NUDIX family)